MFKSNSVSINKKNYIDIKYSTLKKTANVMDKCFVAYDSLNELSFTLRFNAKNQIFPNQT